MPKRTDINTILVIGSGPIVIGQACEFDYSGAQACKVLKEEGYRVVLVNSNPATIMTDPDLVDRTYVEPITCEFIEKIIEREKPDALLATLGGQTALNAAVELAESGILDKHNVELIGCDLAAIQKGENRKLFNEAMAEIGVETARGDYAYSVDQALAIASSIGYPVILRPSFTLGDAGGGLYGYYAYDGYGGVRPALYLESGNLVSDSTDTDGAYILQWNQPPSDPSSISYGTPQAGNSLVLSTGGSTDPEGDAISYVWERKIDSGAYVQLGITTAKTFTDTVPTSGTTYTARVKAVDANGLESGYCTGSAKTISYNTPPMISGSDQNLGAKTAPFTYQYTVTDAQAATQTITVTEKLTNGTQTITLRTYTATSGAQNTVDLSSVWLPLLSGTHVLTITATDSAGGSATRKITFSRTVSRIAAARAFNTDALVQKVFVSLYPAPIPADATLHLEVTNNPFDASPVWVDITDKANRLVHVFTNTTAAKGYGLGYRFYITKGTQEIEITQATIRFA